MRGWAGRWPRGLERAGRGHRTSGHPGHPGCNRASAPPAPAPARRRPLARAAAGSGGCVVIAAAAMRVAFIFDPDPPATAPYHSSASRSFSWPLPPYSRQSASWWSGWPSHWSSDAPAGSADPRRSRAETPWTSASPAASAMARFPPALAPARSAPTCGSSVAAAHLHHHPHRLPSVAVLRGIAARRRPHLAYLRRPRGRCR